MSKNEAKIGCAVNSAENRGFLQGLCYTLAQISRVYGQFEVVWTLLNETNNTVEDMENAKCDPYDLDEVKKALASCTKKQSVLELQQKGFYRSERSKNRKTIRKVTSDQLA